MSNSAGPGQPQAGPVMAGPVTLGPGGPEVSPLAWGMWRFRGQDVRAATALVQAALDAGITLFDTADVYGLDNGEPFGAAEALLGRVFAAEPGLRGRMVLASKGGIIPGIPYDQSVSALIAACEASLLRLNTDCLDLYQIHRPDLLAHPSEWAEALTRLRQAGKIRAAGVSNFTPAQTEALMAFLPFPLAATQPSLSALDVSAIGDGTLDLAMRKSLAVLAWSPLAGGRLLGEALQGRAAEVAAVLDRLAEEHGVGRAEIALAFVMRHPALAIPIIGSQTPQRVAENVRAAGVRLSKAAWYSILEAARGERMP